MKLECKNWAGIKNYLKRFIKKKKKKRKKKERNWNAKLGQRKCRVIYPSVS
jgi:hypothetical protein